MVGGIIRLVTCGFVFAFAVLGVPGTGWVLFFASLEMLWRTLRDLRISSWVSWGSQARLSDLGCNFRGLETSVFVTNRILVFCRCILSMWLSKSRSVDLLSSREPPELEKPWKSSYCRWKTKIDKTPSEIRSRGPRARFPWICDRFGSPGGHLACLWESEAETIDFPMVFLWLRVSQK